jgi:ribosomal protein L40E
MSRDDLETTDAETTAAPGEDAGDPGAPEPDPEASDDEGRELDEEIAAYLRLGLPAATVICAIVGGVLQGAAAVVLVLAAGALVSVIAIFWASIRTLVGETPLSGADAYALGAPRAEAEQKGAVLRALKDLEFEHSVGKISEEDYQGLVAKYRAEGKRLLRRIEEDAAPGRQKVEDLVAERLFREGLVQPSPDPYRGSKSEAKPVKKKKIKPARAQETTENAEAKAKPACASCGTRNDVDAVFCKKCGARQGEAVEKPGPSEKPPEKTEEEAS